MTSTSIITTSNSGNNSSSNGGRRIRNRKQKRKQVQKKTLRWKRIGTRQKQKQNRQKQQKQDYPKINNPQKQEYHQKQHPRSGEGKDVFVDIQDGVVVYRNHEKQQQQEKEKFHGSSPKSNSDSIRSKRRNSTSRSSTSGSKPVICDEMHLYYSSTNTTTAGDTCQDQAIRRRTSPGRSNSHSPKADDPTTSDSSSSSFSLNTVEQIDHTPLEKSSVTACHFPSYSIPLATGGDKKMVTTSKRKIDLLGASYDDYDEDDCYFWPRKHAKQQSTAPEFEHHVRGSDIRSSRGNKNAIKYVLEADGGTPKEKKVILQATSSTVVVRGRSEDGISDDDGKAENCGDKIGRRNSNRDDENYIDDDIGSSLHYEVVTKTTNTTGSRDVNLVTPNDKTGADPESNRNGMSMETKYSSSVEEREREDTKSVRKISTDESVMHHSSESPLENHHSNASDYDDDSGIDDEVNDDVAISGILGKDRNDSNDSDDDDDDDNVNEDLQNSNLFGEGGSVIKDLAGDDDDDCDEENAPISDLKKSDTKNLKDWEDDDDSIPDDMLISDLIRLNDGNALASSTPEKDEVTKGHKSNMKQKKKKPEFANWEEVWEYEEEKGIEYDFKECAEGFDECHILIPRKRAMRCHSMPVDVAKTMTANSRNKGFLWQNVACFLYHGPRPTRSDGKPNSNYKAYFECGVKNCVKYDHCLGWYTMKEIDANKKRLGCI